MYSLSLSLCIHPSIHLYRDPKPSHPCLPLPLPHKHYRIALESRPNVLLPPLLSPPFFLSFFLPPSQPRRSTSMRTSVIHTAPLTLPLSPAERALRPFASSKDTTASAPSDIYGYGCGYGFLWYFPWESKTKGYHFRRGRWLRGEYSIGIDIGG